MARQVNSLSELLSSSASESQIFEGLDELIPSSVLYSLVASTPIVPEPQQQPQPQLPFQVAELPALPEALPEGGFLDMIQYVESLAQPEAELQAPIQAVEQPVFPEAGPSQRRAPRSKRYSHVQIKALETFIAVHPTPTYEQKFLLSQQIGLTMKKINKWILKHKAPVIQSDEQLIAELISRNEELLKEIEELKMQNRILINALQAGNCPQCGGPVPPPGVQQQPRVDVNPPQPEFLEVSSDDSIDQELLWGDIRDFMPTSTEHSLMLVPSEDLLGPAHDLVGVPAEEVSSIVRRARDEFIFMATAGYPLWVSSDSNAFHPETLNYGEYLRMSQRGIPAPFFQSEASRDTATIRASPITIVQTLMEVDQWLHIFCSMITNAQILEVLSPGEEESYKERKQVMSAELVLTTPYVPAREAQFIRYSHQQLDGSWIVVDVSVDELRQFHRPSTRSVCRKRPSGCLIRDMQNGSSLVTWVENVDVREKEDEMHAILKPFVESSFAFGASRWIATLQRQAERFIYSTGINISPSDAPISPEGRRSLTMTANKMVISFCTDICNSTYHHWTSSNKTRQKTMEVKTNKRRGDPGKPPGLHRTAGCTVELISSHNRVFDYLRDIQNRPQWERMSSGSLVQALANITTGPDPRNCISVLAMSNHKEILILQECCTDATGSYVIFGPITPNDFQSMLYGVDQDLPLMPFGFSILPNVSGSILDGTLLTMVFQITVKNVSSKQAVEVVTQIVKEALQKIIEAVN
ncbi:hypothetical protein M0R45_009431 [Rubus argutus]|uniref:START domain-containing protein n=1 Tax=Rubus argutus TaxID=59490 RepID=A0AAW1Y4Z1_RUBAR